MKPKRRVIFAAIIILTIGGYQRAAAEEKKLPNIVILATGGTIAGTAATGTQASYTSGAVTIDAMLAAVPGIKDLANIKAEQLSNVGSQDMTLATYGKNDFYNTPSWKHTTASEFDVANVTRLPRVDILYTYADMAPDLIDASVANGANGIVIAGVGNRNMNKASLEAAARAAKKGVLVVRSSRVVTGAVGRNVEVNDHELNFVASSELNPQKAGILLMLALLKPRTTAEIQNLFDTY
jgi:L-asparaginase/Glu-tRNA(Gln) amidotransferase subunit D